MVIELTGGVGSGKSSVLEILREVFGAAVLQADRIGKELERPGQAGYERIVETFGREFLRADGELDTGKLSRLVFADPEALARINGIIHPLVWKRIHEAAARFRENNPRGGNRPLLVVETAIPDGEPENIYDEIWYVYADKETRIRRLTAERGYSAKKCLAVMENQLSEEEYGRLADRVIDNRGTREALRRQLAEYLGPGSGPSGHNGKAGVRI